MIPKVSIITVCWNAETEIKTTLESVIVQDYKSLEHLIIDGCSTDTTLSIIDTFIKHQPNLFRVISEKDSGIYNAMNKGITYASGDWLLFLNAGDTLASHNSISLLADAISTDVSFVYGDACYIEKNSKYIVKHKSIDSIVSSMPFCHQAILCNKDIVAKYRYNEKYKICADYDMFLRAYLSGEKYKAIDETICNYLVGGFSKQNEKKLIKEYSDIKQSNKLIKNGKYHYLISIMKYYIRRLMINIVPIYLQAKIKKAKYE